MIAAPPAGRDRLDAMDHVDTVTREGLALLDAARAAGLDAPVPTCPDWDVRGLVQHVAKVHQRIEAVVRTHADAPKRASEFPRLADDDTLFDQAGAILLRLTDTLRAADLAAPAWNFTASVPHTAAFWPRRMAHETTVHRVDAELAAGRRPSSVGFGEAVDGIDELVGVLMPGSFARSESTFSATVHLHATDREGEWLINFAGGLMVVTHDHGKGDVAVRGAASDLFLWAWDRRALADTELEVFGDRALLDVWPTLVP